MRLQQLLSGLLENFIGLPSEKVNEAVIETQRFIVETLALDRSTLWQITEDQSGMVLTHHWQRPDWPPLPVRLETKGNLPWMHARIRNGECVSFSSIDELPADAMRDMEMFRIHGPKSNITIPLTVNGEVFGALAFATLGKERVWTGDEIADLKLIAEIIGNVISRQRAEIRADQLRAEIMHSTRAAMLGELAATMAHELNQPLTAILSNAQAARRFMAADENVNPGEIQSILDDIVRDSKRAGSVIHNLRAMLSKEPAAREICSINEIIREAIEFMHGELVGHQTQVQYRLPDNIAPVSIEKVEMQQVLMNLLLNAIQAMEQTPPESRFIEINTSCIDGAVKVEVRDNGCGIPSDRLSEIFAPFYTTKNTGLGMGLAICRRMIEAHSGRIQAINHKNGGSSIIFMLPSITVDQGK